tara:strand:- start:557 stop:1231 length:675 start_codon:yes stop_codon:yes gene_type:complete
MNNIPEELICKIHHYLKIPKNMTFQQLLTCYTNNKRLLMVFYTKDTTNETIENYMKDLHVLYNLCLKYNNYLSCGDSFGIEKYHYNTSIPLDSAIIDLLCTGCYLPYAESTFTHFDDDMYNDLKSMIRIYPDILKSTYGQLRCRYKLSPLDIACNNEYMPVYVIKYLIENGADMNYQYEMNGFKIHVLHDIGDNNSMNYRYKNIKKIFTDKGFNMDNIKYERHR